MKTYELTYIVNPTASQEEVESIQKEVESLIQAQEGVILKSDRMGAKTLSYPIKNQISGYFTDIVFQVSEEKIKELRDKLLQEKKVIRHIITIKKPAKEIKVRSPRKFSLKTDIAKTIFKGGFLGKKEEKVEVKEEEINKKLDEILSE